MSSSGSPPSDPPGLTRVLGLPGAVGMGLGSIVGTGIFVSIGTAAGVAGSGVLVAVVLAALVAACNGLSSAQLAAAHPVSGGAYEYGYRYASPGVGRVAGWAFVAAKTASAATAALGFAGYAQALAGHGDRTSQIALGVAAVIALTAIVAGGIQRSNRTNAVIIGITLAALVAFVVGGLPHVELANLRIAGARSASGVAHALSARDIAHATALMFVAYTGYGRIATLGEEVRDPAHTIPRAIVTTLAVALVLYLAVTTVAVGAAGADHLAAATHHGAAPLETLAAGFGAPLRYAVAVGAITAMLGVILNLVLGISRVVLAMARRGDLPRGLAHVAATKAATSGPAPSAAATSSPASSTTRAPASSPRRAVLVTGAAIAALALVGSVKTTWSFSALFVLVYYGIVNYCALRQPADQRRYPRAVPIAGLASCVGLAVWLAISWAS